MNLVKNIYFAATAQVNKIQIDPRSTPRWMLFTATSALGLSLFSSTMWSIGLVQALSLALIAWRYGSGTKDNLAKCYFVVLFAPISIAILIILDAPGAFIFPLYLAYGAVIGRAVSQAASGQHQLSMTMPAQTKDEEADRLRNLRSGHRPGSYLVESGPVIGSFQGCDFVSHFIDVQGRKFVYSGTLQDSDDVLLDEVESFVVPPGLVYRREFE
jgi:hypothetical protein